MKKLWTLRISQTRELSLNRQPKYGGCNKGLRIICLIRTLIQGVFKVTSSLYFVLDCESKRLILRRLNPLYRAVPRIFCLRRQTPQTFTGISRIQTGFLVEHYRLEKKISFPGGDNCPPAPPPPAMYGPAVVNRGLCQVTVSETCKTPYLWSSTHYQLRIPLRSRSSKRASVRSTVQPLPRQKAAFLREKVVRLLTPTELTRQCHLKFLPNPSQTAWN